MAAFRGLGNLMVSVVHKGNAYSSRQKNSVFGLSGLYVNCLVVVVDEFIVHSFFEVGA